MAAAKKTPKPLPKLVERAIAAEYPEAEREAVRRILRRYKDSDGLVRILLAVLALAEGDREAVRDFVKAAKEDWRDVLYWAEYPRDAGTGKTHKQMAERYRKMGVPVPEDLQGRG